MTKNIVEQVRQYIYDCRDGELLYSEQARQIDQFYQQRITDAVLKIPGIPHNVVITAIKQELGDES